MTHIALGIRGGIAAYKCPDLVSRLVQRGFDVTVILSPAAEAFVAPLALAAMSGRTVLTEKDFFAPSGGVLHVDLQRRADLLLLAPLTAKGLADLAQGRSGDLLGAVTLGFTGPVVAAPAMEASMWHHPATQRNMETIQSDGVVVVPPEQGRLASGDQGIGRMAGADTLVFAVESALSRKDLRGVRLIVTAGPTREAIDPVRHLSNPSTGRMGIAVAERAVQRGAEVHLILGPTEQPVRGPVRVDAVDTSEEMFERLRALWPEADALVAAAAVADQRPVCRFEQKVHKGDLSPVLELEPTPDLLAWAGLHNDSGRMLVGFAAETEHPLDGGQRKLEGKGLDLIAVNLVGTPGTGFASDENHVWLMSRDGATEEVEGSKWAIADRLLDRVAARFSRG